MSSTRCHTFTGQGFDPFNPRPEDVRIADIAHHLAMICRFGGATPVFYSVAQHSVLVARLVLEISGDPLWALYGLHHDNGESAMGDIRRPLKHFILIQGSAMKQCAFTHDLSFESWEMMVHDVCTHGLGIPALGDEEEEAWKLIEAADDAMLHAEMHGMFGEVIERQSMILARSVRPENAWDWETAKRNFWNLHEELMGKVREVRG